MVVLDSTLTFLLGYDTIGSGCIAAMDLNDLSTCFPSLGMDNIKIGFDIRLTICEPTACPGQVSHLLSGSCAIRVGPKAVHPKPRRIGGWWMLDWRDINSKHSNVNFNIYNIYIYRKLAYNSIIMYICIYIMYCVQVSCSSPSRPSTISQREPSLLPVFQIWFADNFGWYLTLQSFTYGYGRVKRPVDRIKIKYWIWPIQTISNWTLHLFAGPQDIHGSFINTEAAVSGKWRKFQS